ncbi:MAG: hypothetical protein HQL12_01620 [Candidatus Omnitrophica bacterium]|nr:hypothetical protein [Candidatus Omnitrophota bacterium]
MKSYVFKSIAVLVIFAFIQTSIFPVSFAQQTDGLSFSLPKPGSMVRLSSDFTPAILKGIIINPQNAFKFDFIVYKGDKVFTDSQKKQEYTKLIKYFLASLAVPDEDQWVNLSPYEKNRIIKDDFGKTEMGRDLLAQDYILKQITASLIYPQDKLGQKFWNEVYERAHKQYGTTNIPVNTFNKVWIVPDNANIYEKGNVAYLYKSHLKVMLEEDYLALSKNALRPNSPRLGERINSLGSQVIREVVLPELEREVNEGKNFAPLRQVFSGMILAAWYKRALRESLLARIYANKAKVKGVDQDPKNNEAIYQQYLQAFKKGVFNFIKEDADKYTNETMPRKYFSGGATSFRQGNYNPKTRLRDLIGLDVNPPGAERGASADLKKGNMDLAQTSVDPADAAMSALLDPYNNNGDKRIPDANSAKTGKELAERLKKYAFHPIEAIQEIGNRDAFVLFEALLRPGAFVAREFEEKIGDVDISNVTGEGLVRWLYDRGVMKYVQGSEVPASFTINRAPPTPSVTAQISRPPVQTSSAPDQTPRASAQNPFVPQSANLSSWWTDLEKKINSSVGAGYFVSLTQQADNKAAVEIKVPAIIGQEGFVSKGVIDFNDPDIDKRFKRIIYDVSQFGEGYGGPEGTVRQSLRELGMTFTDRQVTEPAKQRTIGQVKSDLTLELPDYNSMKFVENKGGQETAQAFLDAFRIAVQEAQQMTFHSSSEFYAYRESLQYGPLDKQAFLNAGLKADEVFKELEAHFPWSDNGSVGRLSGDIRDMYTQMRTSFGENADKVRNVLFTSYAYGQTAESKMKDIAIRLFYNDNGYAMSLNRARIERKFALLEEFYKMRGDMAMTKPFHADAAMVIAKLRNGSEEYLSAVNLIFVSLKTLMEEGFLGALALYELHQKALNPSHKIDEEYSQPLRELNLVQSDGELHDTTKNIVLSSIDGEGLDMHLVKPVVSTRDAAMAVNLEDAKSKLRDILGDLESTSSRGVDPYYNDGHLYMFNARRSSLTSSESIIGFINPIIDSLQGILKKDGDRGRIRYGDRNWSAMTKAQRQLGELVTALNQNAVSDDAMTAEKAYKNIRQAIANVSPKNREQDKYVKEFVTKFEALGNTPSTDDLRALLEEYLLIRPEPEKRDLSVMRHHQGFETVPDIGSYMFFVSDLENVLSRIDQAMKTATKAGTADMADLIEKSKKNEGGIDLNAANLTLNIKRDGHGVPLPVSQQNLENIKIDGLTPVILDIKPAMDSPLLAQLQIAGV